MNNSNYITTSKFMVFSSQKFDTEVLSRISSLKMSAVNLVEGLLTGQHRSLHKGSSIEFAEYKDYSPGDEIRHIDWKVAGKTDKYHVKQFQQSTNLKCTILLDTSGSMGYESPLNGHTPKKMECARNLVAALSYLLLKQLDAVGLTLFNDQVIEYIPPRSKASHFKNILFGLANISPQGSTDIVEVLVGLSERLPKRSMLIIVSDFFIQNQDLQKSLKLLCSRDIEVVLFHVLHPDEIYLSFEGDIVFDCIETDLSIELNPHDIQEEYQNEIQNHINSLKESCNGLGVDYVFLDTSDSLDQALSYYLMKRKSLVNL